VEAAGETARPDAAHDGALAAHAAEHTDRAGGARRAEDRMFGDDATYPPSNRTNRTRNGSSARRRFTSAFAEAEKTPTKANRAARHATQRGPPKRITLVEVATIKITLVVTHLLASVHLTSLENLLLDEALFRGEETCRGARLLATHNPGGFFVDFCEFSMTLYDASQHSPLLVIGIVPLTLKLFEGAFKVTQAD
jgi:hypothetical protein